MVGDADKVALGVERVHHRPLVGLDASACFLEFEIESVELATGNGKEQVRDAGDDPLGFEFQSGPPSAPVPVRDGVEEVDFREGGGERERPGDDLDLQVRLLALPR